MRMDIETAREMLAEHAWEHPSDYGGFSPEGDYVILTQHRDSSAAERSNYECAYRELKAEPFEANPYRHDDYDERFAERPAAYDFRAGHWAVGWVEYLLVRRDAPDEVLCAAAEIVCSLADYPILDEEHFSNLEYEENSNFWARSSIRDRLELLEQSDAECSMFAVRRDELPDDSNLYDYLRSI